MTTNPIILIVDDTESARETLGDLLSIEEYTLLFAESGNKGLKLAEQYLPDLILLDVMMPGMDGFEVCRRIRSNELLSTIPVILITALDDKDSTIEGIKSGADDFISKPFDRHLLRVRIRTIVKLNRFGKLAQERKEKEETQRFLEKEKELNELKSRFISMVSHEFRTPLAAINFAAGFMLKYGDKLDQEKRSRKLSKIITQVDHMVNMLNDVLSIGRNEAGVIKIEKKVHKFNEFITPIIEDTEEAFQHSHKIVFQPAPESCTLQLDDKIGREIFTNLLSNAIKFSPKSNKIDIRTAYSDGILEIEIQDYGIGIPEEDQKRLFVPFHRGTNVEGIQGTGLGLKIVKDAIEIHDGEISIKSKENQGTSFFI
ncbi:MAG: response regulator, partial [Okeania sp. SIO3C4]|nr:response regulator [Okeania sp. SIO3C4]